MALNFLSFLNHSRQALSLDISDRSIKLLQFKKIKGSSLAIQAINYTALEEQIVENGEVLDEEKLSAAIRDTYEKAYPRPVASRNVLLAIPETVVILGFVIAAMIIFVM